MENEQVMPGEAESSELTASESQQEKIASLEKELRKKEREISRLQRAVEQEKIYANAKANQLAARTLSQRERDRFLQLLLTNSPNIILFFDRSERIVFCSDAFMNFMGKTNVSVSGRLISDVLNGLCEHELIEAISANLKAVLASNEPCSFSGEMGLLHDMRIGKYLILFTPMTNQDNESEGAMLWFQDITDIERAREDAEHASMAKSEFLSNMSHEMRTPMNAIIGMTTIAKDSDSVERKNYCLKKIDEASIHLLGVINDILDMSKIEANKLELSMESFDFERMIRKVVNVVYFKIEERRQRLIINLDNNIPQSLIGDDQHLAQIITNLLSNAIKFTPEEGTISLCANLVKEESGIYTIQISVTDTGIGISPEQQSHLFQSFQQADNSTSRKFGGTGLGLAISKRIVEMMSGSIHVESELGKGSTFIFTIQAKAGIEKAANVLSPDIAWNEIRILAVDSSRETLDYFSAALARISLTCDIAESSQTALEMISKNEKYDICFIDWKMPNMNGIQLAVNIKNSVGKIPALVIISSATEWNAIENEVHNAGIGKYLPKPFFLSDIVDCLNECLSKPLSQPDDAIKIDDFSSFRVLLVEDVEINREIVMAFLEPTGLTIECAENGVHAVQMFKDSPAPYNMVFMDIQMPEMDGYEATRQIRAHEQKPENNVFPKNQIPIVAMTANVFKEDVEKARQAGMNDHIGKPLNIEDVLDKLRKYLWKKSIIAGSLA